MAYIKYKELTQYFNFFKLLDINSLPKYVTDFIESGETIFEAYSTYRDKCVFTDKKIILFDQRGILGKTKKIHIFPYKSISSSAIEYKINKAALLLSMDSGYQVRLNFIKLGAHDKTRLRELYCNVLEKTINFHKG